MAVIYKTLFEVKLMHEFFLTDKNGDPVFALPDQKDRINMLMNEFTSDRKSINADLLFKFPDNLLSVYNLSLIHI